MSEEEKNLFKKIDGQIFEQIDKIKDHPNILVIKDFLGTLEDNVLNTMKYIGTSIFLVIPLIVFVIFKFMNADIEKSIELKKQIIQHSNEIISNKKVIEETARSILSPETIDNQDIFQSKITNIVTPLGIPLDKIKISNFFNEVLPGNISKSEVLIKIGNFTTEDFAVFLKAISFNNKIKLGKIEIKRDPKLKVINGIIKTINFSKDNSTDGY